MVRKAALAKNISKYSNAYTYQMVLKKLTTTFLYKYMRVTELLLVESEG
jgi:hypothetical protein